MGIRLKMQLVEALGSTPAGSTARIALDGPEDLDLVERWCDSTGNTVLVVHPDSVEVMRGRVADPIEALPPERRPGRRLWIYTNFQCNLSCDYCCVSSSPRARPGIVGIDEFARMVSEAAAAGVAELYLTGGEPFMLLDLGERLRIACDTLPTTVLTNAMLWRGERLGRFLSLPREGLTLQISLDSATPELHDRHRGEGSFERAMAGITIALDSGFRVRVAATLGADAAGAEDELAALFDRLGLEEDQRVVRRVARQGEANSGLVVSRTSLVPEICLTVDGVWWHPVAATDPAMKIADDWSPLAETIEKVRAEYRSHRIAGDVLASTFPCA